jgi:hypothetical protein
MGLPKTVQQGLEIDERTETTQWKDTIRKEMQNFLPIFQFIDDDVVPVGYKHITCHMIFGIKMIGLVRNSYLVAGFT